MPFRAIGRSRNDAKVAIVEDSGSSAPMQARGLSIKPAAFMETRREATATGAANSLSTGVHSLPDDRAGGAGNETALMRENNELRATVALLQTRQQGGEDGHSLSRTEPPQYDDLSSARTAPSEEG